MKCAARLNKEDCLGVRLGIQPSRGENWMAVMWKEVSHSGEDDSVDSIEHDIDPNGSDDAASDDNLKVVKPKRKRSLSPNPDDSDISSPHSQIEAPSAKNVVSRATSSPPPKKRPTRRPRRISSKRPDIRATTRIIGSDSPEPPQRREKSRDDLALSLGIKASQESYQIERKMGPGITDEQREEMEFEMAIQLSRQEYEAEMRGERQSKGSEERPTGAATPDSGTVCEEDELPIAAKCSTDIIDESSENAINRMDNSRLDADTTEHMSGERVSATPASSATAGNSRALTNHALTPPASQNSRAPGNHDQPPFDPIQQLRADNAELKDRVATLLAEKAAYSIREAATLMREAAISDREANLLRRVKELEEELDTYKELVFPLSAK